MWVPHPSTIVWVTGSGQDDMGDVTDEHSVGRFWIPDTRYVLTSLLWKASGGTVSASLYLKVDHWSDNQHLDFTLKEWENMGETVSRLAFRPDADEYPQWTFHEGSVLVLEWDNPASPNNHTWSFEAGLAPAILLGS